ncbi:MAG: suppressor of fused domain protein, partial [Coriobacteriia bacterium]|nr:suppressor of fused domain protein [Coriobacteriia bacterium]
VVFEDMISICEPGLAVKHVLFTPPFQWPDNVLTRVDLGDRTIYPLLAVPITDSERDFVYAHGANELESCWENWDTDVLEWNRPSSV